MTNEKATGLTASVWRTFFDTRALGLVVLAVAVLTPVVPVDPRVAIFSMALGVPVSIVLRAATGFVVRHSWVIVVVDTLLIMTAISIDPQIAPAGGVLLLASSSLTAASGWRATVLANIAVAPVVIVVLDRYAPETTLVICEIEPVAGSHA